MKYLNIIKKILLFVSFSSLLVLFFPKDLFWRYWEIAWKMLLVIMFASPLFSIFPKCKIFSFIMSLRKELGIIIWVFAIAHVAGYFLFKKLWIDFFLNPIMWDPTHYFGWGTFALLVTIPLLITSNNYSMKLLGKKWKKLQYLAYFMLIFTAIHIALVDNEKILPLSIVISFYLILKVLAFIKKRKK